MQTLSPYFPLVTFGAPKWDGSDEAEGRAFFAGPVGQRLLQNLLYRRPNVTAKESALRIVQSDVRAGYETCIADILGLLDPAKTPEVNP
jgi:hypothetical protein